MKRAAVIKHFKYVEAFKNGKDIQYREDMDKKWYTASSPTFDEHIEYRVKPESEIIPFTYLNAEDLIGKAIISKTDKSAVILIGMVVKDGVFLSNCIHMILFTDLLDCFTFLDGSPMGITIQNE